jgi:hypothetical protein
MYTSRSLPFASTPYTRKVAMLKSANHVWCEAVLNTDSLLGRDRETSVAKPPVHVNCRTLLEFTQC